MSISDLENTLFTSERVGGHILLQGETTITVPALSITGGEIIPGRATETIAHGQSFTPYSFILFKVAGTAGWFDLGTEPGGASSGYGVDTGYSAAVCYTDATNLYITGIHADSSINTKDIDVKYYVYSFGDDIT